MHPDNEPGYVFLVTYGRSGSTLVMHFINRLPGILMRGENGGFLVASWQQRRRFRELAQQWKRQITDCTHPWYGIERSDLEAYERGSRQLLVESLIQPEGGERFIGFKEIRHSTRHAFASAEHFDEYCNWLLSWPQAKIIFLVRNPEVASRSAFWRTHDQPTVEADMREQERRFIEISNAHPDSALLVRYEEFCASIGPAEKVGALLGVSDVSAAYRVAMDTPLDHART